MGHFRRRNFRGFINLIFFILLFFLPGVAKQDNFFDDFFSMNRANWDMITEGNGRIYIDGGKAVLDTGRHGGCNLVSRKGYDLSQNGIILEVRLRNNFNYIYGNDFSIGLRNRYNSHDYMIELNKLHAPRYGRNLDNYNQFRLVTRILGDWYNTSPITATFSNFVIIKFVCSSSEIKLYVDGEYKASSRAYITSQRVYPYFRASNADQYGQKSMVIDYVKVDTFPYTDQESSRTDSSDLYDNFDDLNRTNWEVITEGSGNIYAENGMVILDTGRHGGCNLISRRGYNLSRNGIIFIVRLRNNFSYIYGNDFSIGLRNRYNSHDHMIELNKLHAPRYGRNLDNYNQFRLVTRVLGDWYYTSPITATFSDFTEIKFVCTSSEIKLYVNGKYMANSRSKITTNMLYIYFRASNADQYGQKSMYIDWVKVVTF